MDTGGAGMNKLTVELHLGDCLEVMRSMPDKSVDAVVTDPPYCSGGFSETGRRQAKGQGLRSETLREAGWFINDNMGTAGLIWLLRQMATEAHRLLKDGCSMCVFTDWRMVSTLAPALESTGFRWQNLVVWDKGNPGLGFGFRPQHEIILHYVKGTGKYYRKDISNVLRAKRVPAQEKDHQTQKPVDLIEQLVTLVADAGDVVLDPFAGSGTTGVACAQTGRNFIGVEIDPEYYAIAEKRIAEAQKRLRLI